MAMVLRGRVGRLSQPQTQVLAIVFGWPEVGSPEHARNVVASWLLEHHDHPATTDADDIREGALTSEWHVNATVQAYQRRFPATLHFSQYTSSFRVEIPCLLYTHASTDATGHFERWSPGKRG